MRIVIAVSLALIPSLAASQTAPGPLRIRTDGNAAATAVAHQTMPPGWHITTGPGAVLYDPAHQARGRFAVEAEIFLFPGDGTEGYGVFLGGTNLEGSGAAWTAFLLTRDGSASIEQYANGSRTVIFPVTKSPAVRPHTGEGTAHNILRVVVQGDSVTFSANGQRIAAVPRGNLPLEGTFGFRAGNNLNLHASNLDLVTRLAPFPQRR